MARRAGLAATLLLAACDDPLQPRPAPSVARLAIFAVLDPDRFSSPILVQQTHGALLDLTATLRSGDTTVASAETPAAVDVNALQREIAPCVSRYRQESFSTPWLMRCVRLPMIPRFGETYELEVSAPGRPTVRGATTVPGDFEIVAHELERLPSGDIRLDVDWRPSAGSHRYLVSVVGMQTGMPAKCGLDTTCNDRWFTVTSDTSVHTVIDARFFENSEPSAYNTYGVAVHALNEHLYGYMLTGVTSDFFPVPPAQNAIGGLGAVGSWVRRVIVTREGVTVQRVAGGMRITNGRSEPFDFEFIVAFDYTAGVQCYSKNPPTCTRLGAGESRFVPYSEIVGLYRYPELPEYVNELEVTLWTAPGQMIMRMPIAFF